MLKVGGGGGKETSKKKKGIPPTAEKKISEYEFVWFNAWLYNGTDELWAGLIKDLYKAVENHYGQEYTYALKKAQLLVTVLKLIVPTGIIAGGVAIFYYLQNEAESSVDYMTTLIGGIVSMLIGLVASVQIFRSFLSERLRYSDKVQADVAAPSYKTKLGYMSEVKKELLKIADHLRHPEKRPTVLDYILDSVLPFKVKPLLHDAGLDFIVDWLITFLGLRTHRLPCSLVIFVDDLDRCSPEKCTEVMQALVLLTEGTPFILFLAADPRYGVHEPAMHALSARWAMK